jgi:ATP-dependent Clp protease ATP-binding subunit ClpC
VESTRDEYEPVEYLRRLTTKGRRILAQAELEATSLGHSSVGADHLLLAILASPQTAAARILREAHVDVLKLRGAVVAALGPGGDHATGRRPLGSGGRNALRAAALEAERTGVRFIGTEHLLLGVLAHHGRLAGEGLRQAGLDFRSVRRRIEASYRPGRVGGGGRRAVPRGRRRAKSPLAEYGHDVTRAAERGDLDPVVGRRAEMDRMIEILVRRTKNNPVLVGDAGVGKTAIVEGLAQRIKRGDVPPDLRAARIVALDLAATIAGTKYRGEFEERVQGVIAEARGDSNVILFIDEVHTVVGAGGAAGSLDAANMLKGHLSRGELRLIGATTWREYRRHIANDKSLTRRLQPIDVGEPDDESAIAIVQGLRPVYEQYHGVKISDEALLASVSMSRRYLTERQLPDKAIDLIDEAAAKAKVARLTAPERLRQLEQRLDDLATQRADLGVDGQPAHVLELAAAEAKLREELRDERRAWEAEARANTPVIGVNEVAGIVSRWSGVPMPTLIEAEAERFLAIESLLQKRVVGQDEALGEFARSLRRAVAGMRDPRRPIGSFLLVGPTGVGKTETAKAAAEFVSGDELKLVRVDMSEFGEWHAVSRLVGSPPGYVGHDQAGELTEAVRRNPFSVVLFDDVEKAHPRTLHILLQVMEDGVLTDANGRTVDFRSTIIVLTSNLGVEESRGPKIGFTSGLAQQAGERAAFESRMREHARRHLPAEFLNRIDRLLVFHDLGDAELREIARRLLSAAILRARAVGLELHVTSEALDYVVRVGAARNQGARPVRQLVSRYVDEPLTEHVVDGDGAGKVFELRVEDGEPVVVQVQRAVTEAAPAPPG